MSKRLKTAVRLFSFFFLTCSIFNKKAHFALHKIYIYSIAHVDASLYTRCRADVFGQLAPGPAATESICWMFRMKGTAFSM